MSLAAFRHYLINNPLYLYCLLKQKYRQHQRCRWVDRYARTDRPVPPPLVYKLALTDKCNLACTMCMNRPKSRADARLGHQELDYELLVKLLAHARRDEPTVILSGGEPLLYHRFPDLLEFLEHSRIPTNICTNGTAVLKHLRSFRRARYINLTVSLDGVRDVNDTIRGVGVHDRVVSAIRTLRKTCEHRIHIGVQHTIGPENVGSMHRFCQAMVALGVDWILLNPRWYMSERQAQEYGAFMQTEYGVRARSQWGYVMNYPLDFGALAEQLAKIDAQRWPIQISCYFRDPLAEAQSLHRDVAQAPAHVCYKQWIRMDIAPNGNVVSCQQYPDLSLGDLHRQEARDIWNSDSFRSFRDSVLRRPLPVCRKCAPHYLYERKRWRL